jgi:hypothetical protein
MMASRRDAPAALIAVALLVAGLVAPFVWFRVGSSALVRHVRGMEDRAIQVIERSRVAELELRYGPTRKEEGQIRVAWALSMIGSPELLRMAFQDDPYWQPGRGVWVTSVYGSPLGMRQTCLRIAGHIGEPAVRCPDMGPDKDSQEYEYWLPIEEHGAEGGVSIHLRRLRDAEGLLEREFSVVAEFSVKAWGNLREPGTGSCP